MKTKTTETTEPKKLVVIVRGPPGAGKSTFIKKHYPTAEVCSNDHFWLKRYIPGSALAAGSILIPVKGGHFCEYQYDGNRLAEAIAQCTERFIEFVKRDSPLIVLDNTFIKFWEYVNYQNIARSHGYTVRVIEIIPITVRGLKHLIGRCVHGVPREKIVSMCLSFEEFEDDWQYDSENHDLVHDGLDV